MPTEQLFDRYYFTNVQFGVAHTDVLVTHEFAPANPDHIDYIVLQKNVPCEIYVDRAVGRKSWGSGYIYLRCNVDNAQADLLIFLRPEEIETDWPATVSKDIDLIGDLNLSNGDPIVIYPEPSAGTSTCTNYGLQWVPLGPSISGQFGIGATDSGSQKIVIISTVTSLDSEYAAIKLYTEDGTAFAHPAHSWLWLGSDPNESKVGEVELGIHDDLHTMTFNLNGTAGNATLTVPHDFAISASNVGINSGDLTLQATNRTNTIYINTSAGYESRIRFYQTGVADWYIYNPASSSNLNFYDYTGTPGIRMSLNTSGHLSVGGTYGWTIGALSGAPRICYGVTAGTFSIVKADGAYASLEAATGTFNGPLLPYANNSWDLGSSSYKWKNGYFAGTLEWGGGSSIASSNNVLQNPVGATFYPSAADTYDLGTGTYYFKHLYINPETTTGNDYPIVFSTGNKKVYYKTDGLDTTISGDCINSLTIEKGIVTGYGTGSVPSGGTSGSITVDGTTHNFNSYGLYTGTT